MSMMEKLKVIDCSIKELPVWIRYKVTFLSLINKNILIKVIVNKEKYGKDGVTTLNFSEVQINPRQLHDGI